MKTFREALAAGLADLGLHIPQAQQEKLTQFAALVEEGNRRQNLTRITSPQEMAVKHFVDSLSCLLVKPEETGVRCLDVGTGPGFPGIPLAICRPGWQVVLLDSLRKRLAFLDSAVKELGLQNTDTVHARAEDAGRDSGFRESFDFVVSRAVARLPILLELCLPFVKVGGMFVAMKGAEGKIEVEESGNALSQLGGAVDNIVEFTLPQGFGERMLIVVQKVNPTKQMFPRRAGIPAKQPL